MEAFHQMSPEWVKFAVFTGFSFLSMTALNIFCTAINVLSLHVYFLNKTLFLKITQHWGLSL